jgi:DNA-binding transcriptional LysR family regulator
LSDLLVFVRVVELKSFSETARVTGLTKSAVSKQIKRLEDALGTRLLNRTTRHLGLTETGNAVYMHGVRIAEEAAALCSSVDDLQDKPRGRLRVTTSVAFGNMHLVRLINEFLAIYPDIRVSLVLSDRYVDVVDEGFDIAIRLTSKPIESFVARRLSSIKYVVCATPDYLRTHPPIIGVEDLASHNCFLNGSGHAQNVSWKFTKDGKEFSVKVDGRFTVNSSESMRIAVLGGGGVSLLPTFAVSDDLNAGRLCVVLPEFVVEGGFGNNIYAIFIPSKFLSPKVRVFVDYLVSKFEAGGDWDRAVCPYASSVN